MGRAYSFNYWNPNGHYELNLANPVERDIAVTLFIINKEASKKIAAGERADRSQMGNKSCFRNETVNGKSFIMSPEWQVPHNGALEFDFMYLLEVPDSAMIIPDDQVGVLLEWFRIKVQEDKVDASQLAYAFVGISDFLILRSDQLGLFVDLIDGKHLYIPHPFNYRPNLED